MIVDDSSKEQHDALVKVIRDAKPDFIITEDDFSIAAAQGCYCKYHLKAFEKLSGKYYSREELAHIFASDSPKDIEIAKLWRENLKNSLVNFAKERNLEVIRDEYDNIIIKKPASPLFIRLFLI